MSVNVLGVQSDPRTGDMITGCRNAIMSTDMAAQVYCTQGSYSTAVGASGGTHAGGGALDFSRFRRDGREWTWAELSTIAICLRQVGFAAWPRERIAGTWERHVHAEAVNCSDASQAARNQWVAYRNHRDGLAGNAPDPLPYYDITWEQFHAANPYVLEDVMASKQEVVSGVLDAMIDNPAGGKSPLNAIVSANYRELQQFRANVGQRLDYLGMRGDSNSEKLNALQKTVEELVAKLKPYVDGPEAPEAAAADDDYIAPH
jgi:hypothetical protein